MAEEIFCGFLSFTLLFIFSLFKTSLKITLVREFFLLEIIITDYLQSIKQTKTDGAGVSSPIPLRGLRRQRIPEPKHRALWSSENNVLILLKSHYLRKSRIARHSSKNRIFFYFAKTSLLVTLFKEK